MVRNCCICPNKVFRKGDQGREIPSNNVSLISYHQFPADKELNSRWKQIILQHMPTWKELKTNVICSEHFKPEDFTTTPCNGRRLKTNTSIVPSIFPNIKLRPTRTKKLWEIRKAEALAAEKQPVHSTLLTSTMPSTSDEKEIIICDVTDNDTDTHCQEVLKTDLHTPHARYNPTENVVIIPALSFNRDDFNSTLDNNQIYSNSPSIANRRLEFEFASCSVVDSTGDPADINCSTEPQYLEIDSEKVVEQYSEVDSEEFSSCEDDTPRKKKLKRMVKIFRISHKINTEKPQENVDSIMDIETATKIANLEGKIKAMQVSQTRRGQIIKNLKRKLQRREIKIIELKKELKELENNKLTSSETKNLLNTFLPSHTASLINRVLEEGQKFVSNSRSKLTTESASDEEGNTSRNNVEGVDHSYCLIPEGCGMKTNPIHSTQMGKTYDPDIRRFAITLYNYSPRAYKFVRSSFMNVLPFHKTIRIWKRKMNAEIGCTEEKNI